MRLELKARTAILILLAGVTLQGCVGGDCTPVDPPDLSDTELGVVRAEVEASLGEPIAARETEYGHVSVYRYLQETCGGFVFPVPFILILPLYWEDGALLTVEYTAEGRVISAQMWPDTENSEDAIEHYKERAKLREECRPPFPVAAQLDKEAQIEQVASCKQFGFSTVWQWECLSAHQGDSKAQKQIATYYRLGVAPIDEDFVQAYKWLQLAAGEDDPEDDWRWNALTIRMTPEQITEAERLAFEWEPEPAECEVEFDKSESAEVPPPTWTKKSDKCHLPLSAAIQLEGQVRELLDNFLAVASFEVGLARPVLASYS